MNPEFRQTLQSISRNLESANEAAQENIYTFTQIFIDPCLSGIKSCFQDCAGLCFTRRDDQLRRKRGRSHGRAELSFDFYDDWEDEDDPGQTLLGWTNNDLDRVLAGNQIVTQQPGRQRARSYGSRNRRTSAITPSDAEPDPTIIPSSSKLGFLERLPWKFGQQGLRYKPSAADLQENPGGLRIRDVEEEPLVESEGENEIDTGKRKGHGRQRSATSASRSTVTSHSSRGDLILSDEEDDAVPLDDEFAMILTRRTTTNELEEQSSGKSSGGKRPHPSRGSTRTVSSMSSKSANRSRRSSAKRSGEQTPERRIAMEEEFLVKPASLDELRKEEERARSEQEMEVEKKREAAQKLAVDRGLVSPTPKVSLILL